MALNMETIEKLPTVQKILIVIGIILLIYVLFYFLYVSGKQKTIEDKTRELTQIREKVSKAKAVQAKIKDYEKKREELQKQLEAAKKRLPEKAKIPEILQTLSDLTRGNSLLFPKFKPKKPSPVKGGVADQIPIEVEFVGTYNNIASFLDQVSGLERIITVKNLDLKPRKTKSGVTKLNTKTTLVTYKFKGKKPPPAKGKGGK